MRILSVLLLLPLASIAAAQPAVAAGPAAAEFLSQFDPAGTGSVSWQQFVDFRQQRFALTDTNGDGAVDVEEYVSEYLERLDARLLKALEGHTAQTRTRFTALDADKDGVVSRAEFDAAGERTWAGHQQQVAKAAGAKPSRRDSRDPLRMPTSHSLEGMLEIYDQDGDGRVSRDEFEQVRAAMFSTADRDGKGRLDFDGYAAEFQQRLERRATETRDAAVRQAKVRFTALDADKDGRMTFAEYQVSGKRLFDRADSNHDGVVDARDPAPAESGHGRSAL